VSVDPSRLDDLQSRLDALAARLSEQEERIARQTRIIESFAYQATPAGSTSARVVASRTTSRRSMVRRLGAAAVGAAAVLAFAKEPPSAMASANATIAGASTSLYGVAASPGTFAPDLPPIPGSSIWGVIGVASSVSAAPVQGSGVFGGGNALDGVQGRSNFSYGVYGSSLAANGSGLSGVYGSSLNTFWGALGSVETLGCPGIGGDAGVP
jgi:hypothetical protein